MINAFALSGAAALAPRALGGALAQPSGQGQPPESHFGFEDVVKRARELAAAPYDGSAPKLPDALSKLDFNSYRDLRFKADKSPITTRPLPAAIVPPRLWLQAAGGGQHYPRRHRHADPLFRQPVRLRPQQVRQEPAGQSRLRRLPPALSAEFAAQPGRAGVVPRRLLFPLPRPRPELRPVRARPVGQHRRRRRGISQFPRVLDRDVGERSREGHDLRAARQRLGHRRLSFRAASGRRKRDGSLRHPVPTPRQHEIRHGAADLDVLRRRAAHRGENHRRMASRTARFRRPAHAHRHGRMDLAAVAGAARKGR